MITRVFLTILFFFFLPIFQLSFHVFVFHCMTLLFEALHNHIVNSATDSSVRSKPIAATTESPRLSIIFIIVLVCLSCYSKNTIDWMVYRQQKFISHNSRGQEAQDQGARRFHVWWESVSWFIDSHLFAISSYDRSDKGPLWSLFCKGTNPIHKGFILMT